MTQIDFNALPTPCFVVDEALLKRNLEVLKYVKDQTGCKILLAQKGFSMFHFYPLMAEYLDGTTASSVNEARLGYEEFGKETHVFAPAFKTSEMEYLVTIVDDIVFNTPAQVRKFLPLVKKSGRSIGVGLRVNPQFSTQDPEHAIYDPSAPCSRLGTTQANFDESIVEELDGLHFHTLCQQNSDDLEATLDVFEAKFGKYLHQMKWVNFGGGHHITREDYDLERLIRCVNRVQSTYNVQVYLEPGEAVALNTGFLVSEVLDLNENEMNLAILDTSASCHMPDVLEMPYRPFVIGSGEPNEKPHTYRLGGPTCLAGDVIGDYSFDEPLKVGDRLVFTDMAIYSMVKTNTFNGINLPAIAVHDEREGTRVIHEYGYNDFKERLS
ncbi:MAG: carboxynorspermidine decarboxylase [Aerococcaceae bacterium]|nr:carboxynorspermidine decarboxylase [Aerococcaceae bacterium]